MNRYSSNELIRGIRERDNTILTYIYHKFFQSVLHFVMNNNGTSDDAKDIFQESIIVVFENVRKDPDFRLSSSMHTYVYSIARIMWVKHLNKSKENIKLNESHEYIEFEAPEPFKEHDFHYSLYQKVLLQLPEDCQKILKLSNEGLCYKAIAKNMGLTSDNYIAKRKHYCKEYLIKLIKEDPDFHSDKL